MNLSVLKAPITVKNRSFANRYVCAPLNLNTASEDGLITQATLDIYGARKGPALVITEHHYIDKAGKWSASQAAVDRDECLPGIKALAQVIHDNKQVAVLQISHAGSAVDPAITGQPALGPSAVVHPTKPRSMPVELTLTDIGQLKKAFVAAAVRAKRAGFDGVEVHGAHGYLLSQFFSPLTNTRNDYYGGSVSARARLPLEVMQDIRSAVGDAFLLLYRLGASDCVDNGATLEDGCFLAEQLAGAGVDMIDVSSGLKGSRSYSGRGFFRELFKKVKERVSVPVIGVGGLEDPVLAAEIIENNEADFIALGRGLVRDPEAIKKILQHIVVAPFSK